MKRRRRKAIEAMVFICIVAPIQKLKAQENWTLVGSSGTVSILIDLGSHNQLPNGVTIYKERLRTANPMTGRPMNIDRPRGIDCETKEIVYVADGKREQYGKEKIKEVLKFCPGSKCTSYAIAFTNFCPSGTLK